MNIIIYTKSNCPNCVAAKQLLDDRGIGYAAYSLDNPAIMSLFIQTHPGLRQMHQVFIEGQRVGGLAGLRAALDQIGGNA
jgi:glutaredoxin 3